MVKVKYEKTKIQKVMLLILRTKNHTIRDGNENFDRKVFLDLALLILGIDRESYIEYAKNIRKEYAFISDRFYKKARIKILKRYLNSQFIYKTKKFRDTFEKQVRENIKFEIDEIMSK